MHIWIIMDWNRRWAKERFLPWVMWHKAWSDKFKEILKYIWNNIKKVKYLTFWALSKENLLKRDKNELDEIIKIINKFKDLIIDLQKNNIRFETIWDLEKLPLETQNILKKCKDETKNNSWLTLVVALVYSWKDEIIRAIKKINNLKVDINSLDETSFRTYLDTSIIPPVDLIIRTWGDVRHSWFMLYDCDYSEYFFSKKYWPDFDEKELNRALEFFESSKRNFWK